MLDIYERQKELDLKIPPAVSVIGVGGIGSWVALSFALAGTKKLIIADPDEIELTNLNRTPFKISQIGLKKVYALQTLIQERRLDTEVIAIDKKLEISSNRLKGLIIDCRDNLNDTGIKADIYLRYDGFSMTIMPQLPDKEFIDPSNGYETVPSFVGSPMLLASLVVSLVAYGIVLDTTYTFNVKDILEGLKWKQQRSLQLAGNL